MKEELALRVLGEIMSWDDTRATQEYRWLSLMSRLKYDGYQDYLAGVRFIESLASWMQQLALPEEREKAYRFVRQILVYIGPAEMLRLVELLYPDHVQRRLVRNVATSQGIKPFQVWATAESAAAYDALLRRTLFIGLSEGARLDLFRRANAGVISNEQVLLATYADADKWEKLRDDLRKDLGDTSATFAAIFLIDDFVGSGTTFIRKDKKTGKWKGKLAAFRKTVAPFLSTHFAPHVTVCVHHYLASDQAAACLSSRNKEAEMELGADGWFTGVEFSYGTVLPRDLPIDQAAASAAVAFIDIAKKYFDAEDPSLKNKHTDEGGTDNVALGFAGCALPLVLEHNTPNNSIALLWAETPGHDGYDGKPLRHAMRPLFRRRQRHS